MNRKVATLILALLFCSLFSNIVPVYSADFLVTPAQLSTEDAFLRLTGWKYFAGDIPNGQDPNLDTSSWSEVEQTLEIPKDWRNVGWYRIRLKVDPALLKKQIAYTVRTSGHIRVYLNGSLIHESSTEKFQLKINPFLIQFDTTDNQIAVRYFDPNPGKLSRLNLQPGFVIALKKLEDTKRYMVASTYHMVFLCSVLIAFSLLHFFLYFFDPGEKLNLYFGIFAALIAVLIFTELESFLIDRTEVVVLRRLWGVGQIATILVALRFTYLISNPLLPKQFYVFAIVGMSLLIWGWERLGGGWINPAAASVYISLWSLFAMLELIRILLTQRVKEKLILVIGSAPTILVATYQMLVNLGFAKAPSRFFDYVPLPYYAFLFLAISMSLFLSRNVAKTNRDLKTKLVEVEKLSQIQLEQERKAREVEISRKLLEADNQRKTEELEDARKLQLSMLPAKVPTIPGLELAFSMKTAVEVGGDYYDFHQDNGCLTVAIGDATGHGLMAGTMVTAAKGLFLNLAQESNIPQIMNQMTATFRKMNLGRIFMAMTIAKLYGENLKLVSAGMPPAFLCHQSGDIEVIKTHAIPLGLREFRYEVVEKKIRPGDTLVLLSDGLPEMFNSSNEILGYDRIPGLLSNVFEKSPQEIIDQLLAEANRWAGDKPQDDDMTFVILRILE